jgi:ubiquinone/menaquinone biosynthesis C-methylase UbiE
MNHNDHVSLLRDGVASQGGVWADFGSGTGAFTLALADLIGASGSIYSIDKDQSALKTQERSMREHFPQVSVEYQKADFSRPLKLPPLDGIVMANSLHFHRHKDPIIQLARNYLKPDGRLLLVEYNADQGNLWVPYPISFETWKQIAQNNGLNNTHLLRTVPSRFLGEIYSALSLR